MLCHGDLSLKHIFVTGDGRNGAAVRVSGIIDFGDWQPGAPVHDLAGLRVREPQLHLRAQGWPFQQACAHESKGLARAPRTTSTRSLTCPSIAVRRLVKESGCGPSRVGTLALPRRMRSLSFAQRARFPPVAAARACGRWELGKDPPRPNCAPSYRCVSFYRAVRRATVEAAACTYVGSGAALSERSWTCRVSGIRRLTPDPRSARIPAHNVRGLGTILGHGTW